MFELSKKFRFEASHQLHLHDGKCKNLHGHSWNGEIIVAGDYLHLDGPKKNMLLDYSDLKTICNKIETMFDHRHLNDVLQTDMPTSEFIAKWIMNTYSIELPSGIKLYKVVVEETCTSRCVYVQDLQS